MTPAKRAVILDSGAISAIAAGDLRARAILVRARREGRDVVIPAPVLTEVHTGRRDHALIDRVIKGVDREIATTPECAREAGVLRARSGVTSVVDAIVMAEAVAMGAATIITSDPGDMERLRDAAGLTRRDIEIVTV